MMSGESAHSSNTWTVLALLFVWVVLVLALVYFYKKLNNHTDGQYTIQRIVFAPGGLRDRLRHGVGALENRLGVHIWPQPREDEQNIGGTDDVEEMEAEGHDKQNDSYAEEDEQNDGDKEDSSSDYSSVDLRERAERQKKKNTEEEKKTKEEKPQQEEEEKEEGAVGGEEKEKEEVKNEEKVGLLVDLKPFTGSAIWSEENKDGSEGNDITLL